jgi:hypothetical protein
MQKNLHWNFRNNLYYTLIHECDIFIDILVWTRHLAVATVKRTKFKTHCRLVSMVIINLCTHCRHDSIIATFPLLSRCHCGHDRNEFLAEEIVQKLVSFWLEFVKVAAKLPIEGMNYFRSLECCDSGFKSHSRHGCLCALILCLGSGFATGWSPVQGVLPTVYKMKKLKKRPRSNKKTVQP